MATSIASAASICPRGAVVHRGVTRRRGARAAAARQMTRAAATYDEVFDGQTGQMEKVLSQAVETASAGGLDWRYRMGVPEDGVEVKPNKVLLVHGAGLVAYTYSKLMKEMQEAGFVCCAPDMPGHGGTSKPAPSAFKYDAAAYSAALEAFISEMGLAADEPVDLVVSGFFTSQARTAGAARRRGWCRSQRLINTRACFSRAPLFLSNIYTARGFTRRRLWWWRSSAHCRQML